MVPVLLWYFTTLIIGVLYVPAALLLFSDWKDGGWPFARFLGLFTGGILTWVLSCIGVPFTALLCTITLLLPAIAFAYILIQRRRRKKITISVSWELIIGEEVVFLVLFFLFVWIIGFRPEAYGTEKFMDYGFITTMLRGTGMPPKDPWYAGKAINYYYGGQYLLAYLIRLTMVTAGEGYTFARALITAASLMLPFSLVGQMLRDRFPRILYHPRRLPRILPEVGGVLGAIAVGLAGNMHYVIYGLIVPFFEKISGKAETTFYWFPDSTRYIGYNPDVEDKTIHEFPSYSSILGDLHAHYINLMFVLVILAVAYTWARRTYSKKTQPLTIDRSAGWQPILRQIWNGLLYPDVLSQPEIWIIGIMTGLFRFTNYWDFPIYFVVCGAILFFVDLKRYRFSAKRFFAVIGSQAVFIVLLGTIAALPFTLTFDMISSSVSFVHSHTPLYQLIVLWGLPVAVSLGFLVEEIWHAHDIRMERAPKQSQRRPDNSDAKAKVSAVFGAILDFFTGRRLPDLVALLLSWCAMGLVLMPEVIYVRDIYEGGHYRANTMFKLTYQSFIMFGIVMGYVLIRALLVRAELLPAIKNNASKAPLSETTILRTTRTVLAIIGIVLLLLTGGYSIHSTKAWFGNVFDGSARISSDASVFVSTSFADDFGAIDWINQNIEGQPTILEANGDSYTGYGRVSVATGCPTVMGWYVHEWLWRNDTNAENLRIADILEIYTTTNPDTVRRLSMKYGVKYIFVGSMEREKYPELQNDTLRAAGKVVYEDHGAYIVEVH